MDDNSEVFTIRARHCKRCGGLLTSNEAVKNGYGHVCKMKMQTERVLPMDGQMNLFGMFNDDKSESDDNP